MPEPTPKWGPGRFSAPGEPGRGCAKQPQGTLEDSPAASRGQQPPVREEALRLTQAREGLPGPRCPCLCPDKVTTVGTLSVLMRCRDSPFGAGTAAMTRSFTEGVLSGMAPVAGRAHALTTSPPGAPCTSSRSRGRNRAGAHSLGARILRGQHSSYLF